MANLVLQRRRRKQCAVQRGLMMVEFLHTFTFVLHIIFHFLVFAQLYYRGLISHGTSDAKVRFLRRCPWREEIRYQYFSHSFHPLQRIFTAAVDPHRSWLTMQWCFQAGFLWYLANQTTRGTEFQSQSKEGHPFHRLRTTPSMNLTWKRVHMETTPSLQIVYVMVQQQQRLEAKVWSFRVKFWVAAMRDTLGTVMISAADGRKDGREDNGKAI